MDFTTPVKSAALSFAASSTSRDTPTGLQIRKPKHEAGKELTRKDLKAQNVQTRTD